ncbi:nucleolar MIF4G domain-containing protein 1-like [Melia azedarach]|uniref:Nucleolar MIF4G domain-containing protein 1-like n=1 Tax=Melia azedarach TaxID=155640 RepID=A0ACC1XP52_MELAZ|nr:nucleolar MIF4G domain-containing protein 1-like [Melia azedarach]
MKLRGDDPATMKDFIPSVQNRVNELKASSGDGQNINGKRMEFMLETILDIKNKKKRPKEGTVQYAKIKKWLQKVLVVKNNFFFLVKEFVLTSLPSTLR